MRDLLKGLAIIAAIIGICLVSLRFYFHNSKSKFGPLTPDTRAHIDSEKNMSVSFFRGEIDPETIEKITFVKFPKEEWATREWKFHYPGFPKTDLTRNQIKELLSQLQRSKKFVKQFEQRVRKDSEGRDVVESVMTERQKELMRDFDKFMDKANSLHQSGQFQAFSKDGRMGVVSVWWVNDIVALHSDWSITPWVNGVNPGIFPIVQDAIKRVQISDVVAIFPELSAEQALQKAESKFGKVYEQALDFMKSSPMFSQTLGKVSEIRPAYGQNWSNWFQEDTFQFTYRVIGEKGYAAVRIFGMRVPDWKLSGAIMFQGNQIEL